MSLGGHKAFSKFLLFTTGEGASPVSLLQRKERYTLLSELMTHDYISVYPCNNEMYRFCLDGNEGFDVMMKCE